MSQTRTIAKGVFAATGAFSVNGKLTNFSLDNLIFAVTASASSSPSAVSDSDLAKMVVRVQLKNSKGANAIIINSVPLNILARYSDYIAGWGSNDADKFGGIAVPVGNIVVDGDDEIDVTISGTGLSQEYTVSVFGYDYLVGPEKILLFDFVDASATQTYQQVDALAVYLALAEGSTPSDSNSIAVNDFYGRNIITELESMALGAALARSGDFDDFGPVWADDTGLSQNMSFKASSDNEMFLVVRRFFDIQRMGLGQQSVIDFTNLLQDIQRTNPDKYKILQYTAKLEASFSK